MRRPLRVRVGALHVAVVVLSAACGRSDSGSHAGANSGGGAGSGSLGGSASGSSGSSGGSSGATPASGGGDAGPIVAPQPLSANIVVDQFGYRPTAEKIAVARAPQMGFDAPSSFVPGAKYALIDAHTGSSVLEGAPTAWNGGATDASSGDKAWWFDFSSVTAPGDYFVLDETQAIRSDVFAISDSVYGDVLAQAVRMLFYQRAGFAKAAQFSGAGWADGASHMGPLQDPHCRLFSSPNDATTEKDVQGGWFDAGDENKYSNWGAQDVIQLLRAYSENPTAFHDDYNIPESGNSIPDVIDEVKWELDWLLRMQNADGSVLSIVGEDSESPPSSATKPSLYGPANTSAAFSSAAAFAYASKVFRSVDPQYAAYADRLKTAAVSAWTWGQANPAVTFQNSGKVGAGEQEIDGAYGLPMRKLEAAVYLFELTGDATYRGVFDASYGQAHLFTQGNYVDPYSIEVQDTLLEYAKANGATAAVAQAIKTAYVAGMGSATNFPSLRTNADPYLAYLQDYVWGSNQVKAAQGIVFYDVIALGLDPSSNADALRGAERYVHYLHGVNPLQIVYLSNMGGHGAASSITRVFHSWFAHGSALWGAVGTSTYGPPPGYLVGGPNPSYSWDACCPSKCSGLSCGASVLSPPHGQPPQKAYKDMNDGWPLDSWSISEPDVGYQANYIRLLSKFVK
ncbi:MAG TPA: glycoside hydrolase family 9 protein [Polyangiaceae bacterium]|nr:glycoside hydrolase family 9 protein [Polyangiaceae bacterium]